MNHASNRNHSVWFYRVITLLLLVMVLIPSSGAQSKKDNENPLWYKRVDVMYLVGGQIYNDAFIYNAGLGMQASYGRIVSKHLLLGGGLGLYRLDNERFIPLYFEALGKRKSKSNTPFIRMQVGYSIGWQEQPGQTEGYDFRGGLHFDAGLGRKFKISSGYSILFQGSYRHQFAQMEYTIFGTQPYLDVLNYDMLVLTLSIMREK